MFVCLVLSKELAFTVMLNVINNNKGLITLGTHQNVNTLGKLCYAKCARAGSLVI